jgi:hypothetical protein
MYLNQLSDKEQIFSSIVLFAKLVATVLDYPWDLEPASR